MHASWSALRILSLAIGLLSIAAAGQTAPPQGAGGRGASAAAGGASIVGTVTADGNRPLAGLTVRAFSRLVLVGYSSVRYTERWAARTNARGEYQLSLPAGDYIVDIPLTQTTLPQSITGAAATAIVNQRIADSLGPPPFIAGRRIGNFAFDTMGAQGPAPTPLVINDGGEIFVYPATIFPSARTTSGARVIALHEGEAFRADFHLAAVAGLRVSGTLTGPPGDVGSIALRLLPVMDDLELFRDGDFEQAVTVTEQRGAFTFLGVPPGRYTLKALYVPSQLPDAAPGGRGAPARVGARGGGSPTPAAMAFVRWAETIVEVRNADLTGVDVPLRPPIRVTGTIRAGADTAQLDFSQAQIMLLANRPVMIAPPAPVAVAADGTFTVRIYGPGLYQAQVSGVPGFVVAGISADAVAPPSRWLGVTRGDIEGVAVTLSAQPLGRGGVRPVPVPTAPPSAPPPPPNPDNAFLAGRVIDGATNAPVPNASVVLQRSGEPVTARRVVLTDESGTFTFGDALAGSYTVTTTAPGYSPSAFGRMRADGATSTLGLAARQRVSGLTIRMWKPGAILGRVADVRAQPIAGLSVVSLRVTELGFRRDYLLHSVARTDPTGGYRFGNLPPGEYVVCASFTPTTIPESINQAFRQEQVTAGRGGATVAALLTESRAPKPVSSSVLIGSSRFVMGGPDSNVAPQPGAISPGGDIRTFGSQCYPAATGWSDAKLVHVDSGTEIRSIDLALSALPTVRVAGTVHGPRGPLPNLGIHLVRASGRNEYVLGGEQLEVAATVSDEGGGFSFLGVPAGRYLLRAWTTHVAGEAPPPAPQIGRPAARPAGITLWAEVPITIGAVNLSELVVTLKPPPRVTGRVVFEGSATQPAAFPLALWTRQQFDPPLPLATTLQADGTFTFQGYAPGHYGLPTNTVGPWRITSATLDGKALPGHAVDLATGDISNLVLTATDRFTTLAGIVASEGGFGPIEAMVGIFPADYKSWFADDMTTTRMRFFRPSGSWTHTATWLPPGDYLAIVYRETEGAEVTPAFIERLAKFATPVTLRLGEATALDLRVVGIR